jgi:hypothetical protein
MSWDIYNMTRSELVSMWEYAEAQVTALQEFALLPEDARPLVDMLKWIDEIAFARITANTGNIFDVETMTVPINHAAQFIDTLRVDGYINFSVVEFNGRRLLNKYRLWYEGIREFREPIED